MSSKKHGTQFDSSRFEDANDDKEIVEGILSDVFNARNVVATEPQEAYDNFAEEKALHQILDYGGTDFVVDTFDSAPFGVNHRTHSATDAKLRFDIRKETGTTKPSELDELLSDGGDFALLPRYASRAKRNGNGKYEWVRIVDLRPLVGAIDAGLRPVKTWSDGDVVAWMFDYQDLHEMGVVECEIQQ